VVASSLLFALPGGFAQATLKGCRIVEWNGRRVSMVCLHLKDGGHVDLFIVRHVNWDHDGPGVEPLLALVGRMNTASWSKNGRTYILSGEATDEQLRRLLSVGRAAGPYGPEFLRKWFVLHFVGNNPRTSVI
jgi:hypothetical protein